jgi:protein-L-isoaspartate O-methyltransferase
MNSKNRETNHLSLIASFHILLELDAERKVLEIGTSTLEVFGLGE